MLLRGSRLTHLSIYGPEVSLEGGRRWGRRGLGLGGGGMENLLSQGCQRSLD